MESLKERIDQAITAAMKAKDAPKLETLRSVKVAAQSLSKEPGDSEYLAGLKKVVKQYKESAAFADMGGRQVALSSANTSVALLEAYLPTSLTEEAVRNLTHEVIAKSGIDLSKKNMGNLVKLVVAEAAGGTDGKTVSSIINELIAAQGA